VAVVGSSEGGITPPCGGCRQVLYEFGGPELVVIVESLAGDVRETFRLDELLPAAFGPRDLLP
jgi:cytidine deaminase